METAITLFNSEESEFYTRFNEAPIIYGFRNLIGGDQIDGQKVD